MSKFDASPRPLRELLSKIESKDLALPNFQRDFVWDPGAISELIESIMKSYPAGSLLFLDHDGEGFQIREFDGAPGFSKNDKCKQLVLDGQQRLTSLYQAFYGKGEHHFFINLKSLHENQDTDGVVIYEKTKKAERKGMLNINYQAKNMILPLSAIFGKENGFHQWLFEVTQANIGSNEEKNAIHSFLNNMYTTWISKITDYHFPVITLISSTPLDAVCKMFETLNRRGVKLTVFELLMARSFSEDVSLRSLWDKAKKDYPLLEKFDIDPYYILQTISLIEKQTIKRKDVLLLEPSVIVKNWGKTEKSVNLAIEFMQKELGIIGPHWIPYTTMIIPLSAIILRTEVLKGPQINTSKSKIKKWFWAAVFSQHYDTGGNSKAITDFKQMIAWILEDGDEPNVIRRFHFNPMDLYEVGPRQRALYKGTISLICSGGAVDFHNGEKLNYDYLKDNKVDDHHIYPKNYLKKKKVKDEKINTVLNRTLIDASTNRRLGDKSPQKYISEIVSELGDVKSAKLLRSHLIELKDLTSDDYESFLENRCEQIFNLLVEKYEGEVPTERPDNFEDLLEDEIEEKELTDPRDRLSPDEINPPPTERLEKSPDAQELYNVFESKIKDYGQEVWWKARKSKLSYFSPTRNFMTVRISNSGLHIVIYTRGKEFQNVTPIKQKDKGGALWGRIKARKLEDLDYVFKTIEFSLNEIRLAEKIGESTGWWASLSTVNK